VDGREAMEKGGEEIRYERDNGKEEREGRMKIRETPLSFNGPPPFIIISSLHFLWYYVACSLCVLSQVTVPPYYCL
jgi:hypothetical protein